MLLYIYVKYRTFWKRNYSPLWYKYLRELIYESERILFQTWKSDYADGINNLVHFGKDGIQCSSNYSNVKINVGKMRWKCLLQRKIFNQRVYTLYIWRYNDIRRLVVLCVRKLVKLIEFIKTWIDFPLENKSNKTYFTKYWRFLEIWSKYAKVRFIEIRAITFRFTFDVNVW